MQDRYAGDIGDFVKYGLLRAIRGTRRVGVAWYLHPDAGPAGDGKHIAYLHDLDRWRHLDPELFDALRDLIQNDQRSVANIQQSGILGDAVFAADRLGVADVKVHHRKPWRRQWFDRIKRQLADCDLVFADPDNGFVQDGRFKPTWQSHAKRIPLTEAVELAEGRTAVVYHHNSMFKGGHYKEIQWWKDQLPEGTMAYYWRRVSNRTFFVINPDDHIRQRLRGFADRWGDRGELN